MKRLIPAFIVLITVISLCFVSNISSKIIVKDLRKQINTLKELRFEGRNKKIKDEIKTIKKSWENKEKYLAVFVNHKPIDGISININNLYHLSSFDNDLYLLFLSEIDYYLNIITKEQSITAESFY